MNKEKLNLNNLKPSIIWITGLPASGKTALALRLVEILKENNFKVEHLDGDEVRKVLPGTGYSREERDLHIKHMGLLASRLESHDIFVVASFVSPFRPAREFVRQLSRRFFEIYMQTPLEVCMSRDPKGLYKKAKRGEILNFTGVDGPYETPIEPELTLDSSVLSIEDEVNLVLKRLGKVSELSQRS
jgi:adenylylsulfate kinase